MDCNYYLLLSLETDNFDTPMLELFNFDTYSALWQYLQDTMFMEDIRWYQIYWGETLMMQKRVR